MTRQIFVNLPVADLPRAVAFYKALGFRPNPRFSDETADGMALNDTIFVMLPTHAKWRSFPDRPIPPDRSSKAMLALMNPVGA